MTQSAQGQTIESKGLADLPYVSHSVRTANVDHNDGVRVSSGATGIKRDVGGDERHSIDVLSGHSNL